MRQPSPQPNVAATAAEPGFVLRFWGLVVAAGVGAGLAGGGLMLLLNGVEHLAWPFPPGGDLLDAFGAASGGRRVACLAVAGVWVGVGGWGLRRAFGPGGEVNATIWFRSGRVPLVATASRAVLSIVAVGLGLSLGREAAVKQTGGAIAARLAGWAGVPPAHRRVLVACGVGAGMAAAYNVPLGGALFALEVLLGTLSVRLVVPAVVMSTVAVATSWLMLPTTPIYTAHAQHLTAAVTVWAAVAGPLFGVVAVAFIRAVGWAGRVRLGGAAAVVAPVVTLALLGVAAVFVPQLLGNGKESVQVAFDAGFTPGQLATLPWLKIAAAAACLAAGARGGLFTPTMMVGAITGGLLGWAWGHVWPGADLGLCALIGSTAVLAAATAGPVSSVVLVLELTRHGDSTMVPTLLAVTGASLTAGRLDPRSVYSARAKPAVADGRPDAVSAATPFPAVARRVIGLLADGRDGVVAVVDDDGRTVGHIGPAEVAAARFRPLPPEAVTAADVARPLPPA